MASRKEYMREWRKGNLVQRHCKDCNVEIGKFKHRCSECRITKRRADSRARYKRNPEIAEKARKWREANPDKCEVYEKRKRDKYVQRHCKKCNVEVGKMKHYCSVCLSIHMKEQKKIYNDKAAGYRKQRYENRDRLAYNAYHREYQKGKKFREYQKKYIKDRYENDEDFRDRLLYNGKRYRERLKQGWYKLRLERIEKIKGCLEIETK